MAENLAAASNAEVWSAESLLAKFQRYMEEAIKHEKKDWKFGLWTSLALESLLRAGLAKTSPVLLADTADWNNIYFALGKVPNAKKFNPKSIATADVITRLESIYPAFDSEHGTAARAITSKRNSELHTAENAFDGENLSGWVSRFFKVAFTLLEILGVPPEDIIDPEEVGYAQKLLDAEEDEAAKSVKKTIAAHTTVWSEKGPEEKAELSAQAIAWASQHLGHRVKCPACECQALVFGDAKSAPATVLEEGEVIEKQKYLPNRFECVACALKVTGFSRLNAAGLGDEFTRTQHYDMFDYFASNVESPADYEPDYNC